MKGKTNKTVAVLGLWHLGMITAVGLSRLGYHIIGFDTDQQKIANLEKGIPPIFEPQLDDYLIKSLKQKTIRFTSNITDVKTADIIYLTLDTPLTENDDVITDELFTIAELLAPVMKNNAIIVVASQVPVGTTEKLAQAIQEKQKTKKFSIAYQPENLRLGHAFERFFNPAMIVIGTQDKKTYERIASLYETIQTKIVWTSVRTAEFVKHAINTFLATSISYANELGNLADISNADFFQVSEILKLDERIGPYARVSPGLGFAGGTLARDVKILEGIGEKHHYATPFITGILAVNDSQKKWVVRTLKKYFTNTLKKKKIGILGLTYTPQTSTLRRSLSVEVINQLSEEGADVYAFDPKASHEELKKHPHIYTVTSILELSKQADALVLMTPWPEFSHIPFKTLKKNMKTPLFIDPNNILKSGSIIEAGFTYIGFGRGGNTSI